MKFFLALILVSSSLWAHEKKVHTKADQFATATFREQRHHPWPFPLLSIGHNMQSYQNYGSSPYWHDGLDIRSNQDQPMFAAAGGIVVNIENYVFGNPMYWEVAILDDEGFVWKYHHVAKDTITKEMKDSLKNKIKVAAGSLIGNVVRWPMVTYGEIYHHLHLLVVAKDKKYINPFLMMEPLADTVAPVISKIGIAKNHRPTEGTIARGDYALFMEASDLTLHDKFILPPYKISYSLDGADEHVVWEFINLPGETSDEKFINDFYMTGTCGNYDCRKFYFNLNFSKEEPRGKMKVSRGEHEVVVSVEDIAGNKALRSFRWTVED